MRKPEKRKLERVRYWQGQMLRSRDFRDIETGEAQRRWWHNRALHSAYGIAEGLNCMPASGMPAGVLVSPGVAYDVFGRELILEKSQLIPLPADAPPNFTGTISLLMRYKPPASAPRPDEAVEICWSALGCIAPGTAAFIWKLGKKLNPSDGVTICAVEYDNGTATIGEPHLHAFARPQSRPLLASSATIPGNTPWNPWSAGFGFNVQGVQIRNDLGVQTWIDTSASGFTLVPCYFAWLEGALWNSQTQQLTPAIFPSITDESVKGFTFRLWLQVIAPQENNIAVVRASGAAASDTGFSFVTDPEKFALFARQQKLYVSWIGCQMQAEVSCCAQPQEAAIAAPGQLVVSSRNP